MGVVNCYLVQSGHRFVLIDTGPASGREKLHAALADAGCGRGDLNLIILTHGDFDHTGNCRSLRERLGAPVAMHPGDAGMIERGDMFWNRRSGNALIGALAPILYRFPRSSRLNPDVWVEDGKSVWEYGLDATVVHLPGHSQGSVGVLMAGGDLFCGDLLENGERPGLGSIMDDAEAAAASIEKLRGVEVATVYPGHGEPFPMAEFFEHYP
jgi:glyoxylase-like metal-dependent hydrolase (beta-lactamase superfamily II)